MPKTMAVTTKYCQKPSIVLRQRRPVQFALKLKAMPIAPMNVTRIKAIVHVLICLPSTPTQRRQTENTRPKQSLAGYHYRSNPKAYGCKVG